MAGKSKYDDQRYEARTTYPLGQVKQILGVMRQIEAGINPNWPELARARYIYETLGNNISFNHNKEERKTQQPSNLSTLLSRKAICAGYSLVFKEMMDRQGIKCDYIRGTAYSERETGRHAWNVLQIDGKNYPIDLTWDSTKMRQGKSLEYFGNNARFEQRHVQDNDEITYYFSTMTPEDLRKSDYRLYNTKEQDEALQNRGSRKNSTEEINNKKSILENAIIATYQKKCTMMSSEEAMVFAKRAVKELIINNRYQGFTRDGFARQNLQIALSAEDAFECIADEYVNRMVNPLKKEPIPKNYSEHYLKSAVGETIAAHSPNQARSALKHFFYENKTSYFTNSGQTRARTTLANNINNMDALNILVEEMVENTIEKDRNITRIVENENENRTRLFSDKDFELAPMPKMNIFQKATNWIKEKMNLRNMSKDKEKTENEQDNSWER